MLSLHHACTGGIFDVLDTPNAKEITHAQLYAGYKGAGALKRGGLTSADSRTRANISLSPPLSLVLEPAQLRIFAAKTARRCAGSLHRARSDTLSVCYFGIRVYIHHIHALEYLRHAPGGGIPLSLKQKGNNKRKESKLTRFHHLPSGAHHIPEHRRRKVPRPPPPHTHTHIYPFAHASHFSIPDHVVFLFLMLFPSFRLLLGPIPWRAA